MPALLAFMKVAETRSFSRAAVLMEVSRSHISKIIQDLEGKFGQPLLNRSTRSVSLTSFGKTYFELCKDHFFEIEKITEQVQKHHEFPTGKIKITLAGAFGEDYIAPLVSRILARNPSLSAELDFSEKIVDLKSSDYHLAIRVGGQNKKNEMAIQIASRDEYVCATRIFLNRAGWPEKPSDLKKLNCLVGSNDQWSFLLNGKTQKVKVSGNFKSSNGRAQAEAALTGLGICKLPSVYVKQPIQEGRLVPLLEKYRIDVDVPWRRHIYLRKNSFIFCLSKQSLGEYYFCATFCSQNRTARLITFILTLWALALKFPTQKCVPLGVSGLHLNRVFVPIRLQFLEIHRLAPNSADSHA